MARKVVLIADPGIDGAFAIAAAVQDSHLDVLAVIATAGNVSAEQATRNVQIILDQVDPSRRPRLGAALPVEYTRDAQALHGKGGLGDVEFPVAELHHQHGGEKLLSDLVRQHPNEVSIALLGPPTMLASTIERDPEIASLIQEVHTVGGTWKVPGDVGPVTEFHFACDPGSARKILNLDLEVTMFPLDVTRKVVFSPTDLLTLEASSTSSSQFLQKIVSHGIGTSSSLFGLEGFYLQDVLAVAALSQPEVIQRESMTVDVEVKGELTAGMSIFDTRWGNNTNSNVDVCVKVDVQAVRQYLGRVLYLQP